MLPCSPESSGAPFLSWKTGLFAAKIIPIQLQFAYFTPSECALKIKQAISQFDGYLSALTPMVPI